MGTNFYVKTKKCPTCGHKPGGIHLGKSSCGWQFSFQYNGGQYYKNVPEMREWLKDKKIEDEYGTNVTPDEFWEMVKEKQAHKLNHAKMMQEEFPNHRGEYVIDGYSFSDVEFS